MSFSNTQSNAKVAVCGASGGIGQPLSLLLKNSPLVTELSLYDIVHTPGVAADLSHIDTASKVTGYNGPENLEKALQGMKKYFYTKHKFCKIAVEFFFRR